MREPTVEEIEHDLGRAGRHLRVAVEELEEAGHDDAAELVETVALVDQGLDLHKMGASVWVQLEEMGPEERVTALGSVFDVARVLLVAGEPEDEAAVVQLVDLLQQVRQVYPRETALAVNDVA